MKRLQEAVRQPYGTALQVLHHDWPRRIWREPFKFIRLEAFIYWTLGFMVHQRASESLESILAYADQSSERQLADLLANQEQSTLLSDLLARKNLKDLSFPQTQ